MAAYLHTIFSRGHVLTVLIPLLILSGLPTHGEDDWGIANPQWGWHQGNEGLAVDGACYGMVRAKVEFQRLGLAGKRSFTEMTTPESRLITDAATGKSMKVVDGSQQLFVEQFAALAQNYALRNRDFNKEVYSTTHDPEAVDRSLVAHGVNDGTPQILILSNRQAVEHDASDTTIPPDRKAHFQSHAVLLEHRDASETAITYTVSDPNHPGAPQTVTYDKDTGQFSGLGGYDTVQHDTSELPEQNRRWLDALVQGGTRPQHERYLPVWRGNQDQPKSEADYLKERQSGNKQHLLEPPAPSEGLNKKISALQPEKVGGVRLYFDPTITTDETQAPARWGMVHELVEQLTAGRTNFLVQTGGQAELTAVRLSAVLRDAANEDAPTLGGLTRVLGFTRNLKTGEIFLLGRQEPERPAIPLDVFTMALRTIWQQGRTPAISLDPNPDDFFGPQHVRTVDLPTEGRATAFTRTMLEADYAMKRIMLGEEHPDIDGYQSYYDLLVAHPELPRAEYVRWWLYPKETNGADVYQMTSGDLETCYFESDVMLLTETMKQAQQVLVGTGTKNALAEYSSQLFTGYYPQLEARYPVFAALHGLFDVAKLAAVLKLKGVQNPLLEAAAKREPAATAIPDSYQGIGPKIIPGGDGETFCYIGGGVQAKARLHAGDVIPKNLLSPSAMQPLASTEADQATLDIDLPTALSLDPAQARHVDSELEASAALDELMSGDAGKALAHIDQVVTAAPDSARARSVRILALMVNGRNTEALHEINLLVAAEPALRGLRGRVRLYAGDQAGALADARAAIAAFPDNPDILAGAVFVLTQTGEWAEAEKHLARLATLSPLDPDVDVLRSDLRLARRLPPQTARAFFQSRLAIPLTTLLKLSRVQQLGEQGDVQQGRKIVQEVLAAAEQHPAPKGDPLYLEERCWVLLANIAAVQRDPAEQHRGWEYLNRVAKRHPDWATPLLLRINMDLHLPLKEAMRLYTRARALPKGTDPFLLETAVMKGSDPFANTGFRLSIRAGAMMMDDPSLNTPAARAFFAQVLAAMPDGPAKHVLAINEYMANQQRKLHGKPLDPAEAKRVQQKLLTPPVPPPHPDAVNLYALENIYLHAVEEVVDDAGDQAQVDQLFPAFQHALNVDWDLPDTLEQAAKVNLTAHTLYAKSLALRLKKQPEVANAVKGTTAGEVTPEELLATLDKTADAAVARLTNIPDSSKALLRAMLCTHYAEILAPADPDAMKAGVLSDEATHVQRLPALPAGLVATRTAALWLDQEAGELLSRHYDPQSAAATAISFHRAAGKMKRVFGMKLAGG